MTRVILLGDPSQGAGVAGRARVPADRRRVWTWPGMGVPFEWFAVSAGAKISMESGTENMDWIGRVLRRLIEFTQAGGEVNVVVCGINVGAQPYWNAEATMLMHTRGILVMTPDERDGAHRQAGARLLGRGLRRGQPRHRRLRPGHGPERPGAVLGAATSPRPAIILLRHYEHTYVAPGERFPRRVPTTDPERPRRPRAYPTATRVRVPDGRARSCRRAPIPTARSRSTSAA